MENPFLSRIKSYKEWEGNKLLVIHMNTPFLDVESCLKLAEIPFTSIYYKDHDFKNKINRKIEDSIGIVITGSRLKGETHQESILNPILEMDIPKLGLCFGCEILAKHIGATIVKCNPPMGEFSEAQCQLENSVLFEGIQTPTSTIVTMAHNYMIGALPLSCESIASTDLTPIAGFQSINKKSFGLQFHPEKGWLGDIVFRNFQKYCKN